MFLTLIVKKLLKKVRRVAVVLPDGTLFGEGVKAKVVNERKSLKSHPSATSVEPSASFAPPTGWGRPGEVQQST